MVYIYACMDVCVCMDIYTHIHLYIKLERTLWRRNEGMFEDGLASLSSVNTL